MKKDLKIFTDKVEGTALDQIYTLANQEAFNGAKIRIMPDVHAGKGCVIGFTADLGDKVIPNVVGVDIGCGMLTVKLDKDTFRDDDDFKILDAIIKRYIPNGSFNHDKAIATLPELREMHCYKKLRNIQKFDRGLGSLGGGNHFIEIAKDSEDDQYLIIHSGSRNVGNQVAIYYQELANEMCINNNILINAKIDSMALNNENKDINNLKNQLINVPEFLYYLKGEFATQYLHDMRICQKYASLNRNTIATEIIKNYYNLSDNDICIVKHNNKFLLQANYKFYEMFETVHNYIDNKNIIRKGAISAKKDEIVLIPINMRDGSILARGKGNIDWNESAPHGAGRVLSRGDAKESLNMEDFKKSMEGIYSTSVLRSTLDESPMAYKPIDEILNSIRDTVDVINILKPIYNFKS